MRRPAMRSRNGCFACKRRKVKCDEAQPKCANCKKYDFQCLYPSPFRASHVGATTGHGDTPMPDRCVTKEHVDDQTNPDHLPLAYTAGDLELLHHFSTESCATISNVPEKCKLYQKHVPLLALHQPYLFHVMQAMAALHLSREHPQEEKRERYVLLSDAHYTAALRSLPSDLEKAVKEDCHSMFAFSSITILLAFGKALASGPVFVEDGSAVAMLEYSTFSTDQADDAYSSPSASSGDPTNHANNPFNPLPTWVTLMRGITSVFLPAREQIRTGPFALAIQNVFEDEPPPLAPKMRRHLQPLKYLWSYENDPFLSEDERKHCDIALEFLCKAFSLTLVGDPAICTLTIVTSWIVTVHKTFISVLVRGRPGAMAIMGWWLRLIGRLRSHWWIGDGPQQYVRCLVNNGWLDELRCSDEERRWFDGGDAVEGLFH